MFAVWSGSTIVGLPIGSYGPDNYSSGINTDVVQISTSLAATFTTILTIPDPG